MRYYSSGLQALRLADARARSVAAEGYVGIYINSSTLNAGRFWQSEDTWSAVFAYYLDLWLASRVLSSIDELWAATGHPDSLGQQIQVLPLLDSAPAASSGNDGLGQLASLLRELDFAINEAAITRELKVNIRSSPGKIPFGIIDLLGQRNDLTELQFALLIDEFENFSDAQQRYLNTLVRDKRPRISFLVGARTGGVKTFATLSGEINREGSEFETILLDSLHLKNPGDYRRFCRSLVARRLVQGGIFAGGQEASVAESLDSHFVTPPHTRLGEQETTTARLSRSLQSISSIARGTCKKRPFKPRNRFARRAMSTSPARRVLGLRWRWGISAVTC
jgi:hypothetical protein